MCAEVQFYPCAVKVCICAAFLDTKLLKKSNLETPEGVPTKAQEPVDINHCT